jgi:hypothetical protein
MNFFIGNSLKNVWNLNELYSPQRFYTKFNASDYTFIFYISQYQNKDDKIYFYFNLTLLILLQSQLHLASPILTKKMISSSLDKMKKI